MYAPPPHHFDSKTWYGQNCTGRTACAGLDPHDNAWGAEQASVAMKDTCTSVGHISSVLVQLQPKPGHHWQLGTFCNNFFGLW